MLPAHLGHYAVLGAFLTVVDGDHHAAAVTADLAHVWARTRMAMVVHDLWPRASVRSAFHAFLRSVPDGSSACQLCAGDHGTAIVYRLGGDR